MPAACSFTDGKFMARYIDLNTVNDRLRWNPYLRDLEATSWGSQLTSPPDQPSSEPELETAIHSAEIFSQQLVEHDEGRFILENDDPGPHAANPQYWFARAEFYKAENQRLIKEKEKRLSRSQTPEYVYPDMFGESVLEKAKGHAQNAACQLATLPAGKAFLAGQDYTGLMEDANYWWNKAQEYCERLHTFNNECIAHRLQLQAHALQEKLATFPAGEAFLKAELEHSTSEPPSNQQRFWRSKTQSYCALYQRLKQDFWNQWKRRNTDKGRSALSASHRLRRKDLRVRIQPLRRCKIYLDVEVTQEASTRIRKRCGRTKGRRSNRDRTYHGIKPVQQPSHPISSRLRSRSQMYDID